MPFGVLAASALLAFGIVVLDPSFVSRAFTEIAQLAASEPTGTSEAPDAVSEPAEASEPTEAGVDCSGSLSSDYSCYQKRYQGLVNGSGVEAAFADLRDEYSNNRFVRSNCHQLVHVIGRAAADLYGDISGTYSRGDPFCTGGYYHGVMEAIVAKIGSDNILNEANSLCASFREGQRYSDFHFDCVHGLGHGFMGIQDNELFKSLETCDALTDGWERENCYGGVFMENVLAKDNPDHPSKYLKADQPLYPCTDVETKYKNLCYQLQTTYALQTQDNDFARVFDLCAKFENSSRPMCYQGLGRDAAWQSIGQVVEEVAEIGYTSTTCMLGKDYEARSNCVVGAAKYFVDHYRGDTVAKTFCESLATDLRAVCLGKGEEHSKEPQPSAKSPKQEIASAGLAPEPKAAPPDKSSEPSYKGSEPSYKSSEQNYASPNVLPEAAKKAEPPKETWTWKEEEPKKYDYYEAEAYPRYPDYGYGYGNRYGYYDYDNDYGYYDYDNGYGYYDYDDGGYGYYDDYGYWD